MEITRLMEMTQVTGMGMGMVMVHLFQFGQPGGFEPEIPHHQTPENQCDGDGKCQTLMVMVMVMVM